VEGPEGSEDWRVYKGKTLLSEFATEAEAREELNRRDIRHSLMKDGHLNQ